jgi:hypothetical protein
MTAPRHWILDRHDDRTIALISAFIGVNAVVLGVVVAAQGNRAGALWDGVVAAGSFASAGWSVRQFRKRSRTD